MFRHLTEHCQIFHYTSPYNVVHVSRKIGPDVEEVEIILAGQGEFDFAGGSYPATEGCMLWYQPGDVVRGRTTTSYDALVFQFEISEPPRGEHVFFSRWQDLDQCRNFCTEVQRLLSNDHLDSYDVQCCYARLFWEARNFQRHTHVTSLPTAVQAALAYIDNNSSKDISIEQIAKAAELSSSHLHLLFRKHLTISPMQYLIRQRVIRAQKLLLSTNHSIKQICFDVGFSDSKYFADRFKRQTSYLPSEYRRIFFR